MATGEVTTMCREISQVEHGLAHSDALASEVSRTAETSVSALEAQARAMVQARFFVAQQPHMQRSWDTIEQKLRKECSRPGFAWAAWWTLPYGNDPKKYPQGLSIRFAEAALRIARNIDIQQQTIFDDTWKRIVRVSVIDLEGNFGYSAEVPIDKTVERKNPADRQVLSARANSTGNTVYLVAATEQELALKQGSAVSKAIRTLGLRLIPGDILDECKALILATQKKGTEAEDPELARKSVLDNFADLGVLPDDIARYLGHDTNIFQPAELIQLRGIFSAIRSGDATWKDVIEAKAGSSPDGGKAEPSKAAAALRDKLAKKDPPKQAPQQQSAKPTTAADPWPEVVAAYGSEDKAIRALASRGFESWSQVNAGDRPALAAALIEAAR
jgi:hypothetical protein